MKKLLLCLLLMLAAGLAAAQSHPRLWITGSDLPRLRLWAQDSNPFWRDAIKPLAERAKAEMDRGDVPRRDCGSTEYEAYPSESYAELFAFMSLVDNDAANRSDYASRARTLLMGIIDLAMQGPAPEANYVCPENQQTGYPPYRSPRFFTEDSNRARWHGEAFPLVVDWIYPVLGSEDKQRIRNVFLRWSQEIVERGYHHPAPVGMVNDPALLANQEQVRWAGNNYFTAHMRNLGMMAMALDSSDDANNQLGNYLANATGAWLYLFDHHTRTESRGGLLPEGYEYSPQTASYAIQFLLALRTAGRDTCGTHCQLAANPFWDDFLTSFYHSLSPATVNEEDLGPVHLPAWYGDGENYHTSDFISAFGALGAFDTLTGNTGRLQSLRWAQNHAMPGGSARLLRRASNPENFRQTILYFMLYDPQAASATDPRSSLPLTFHAEGMHILLSRTSWDSTASWFSYSLPWSQIDHQQANANHFEWYRNGEWLTKARNGYPDIAEGIASSEFKNLIALENTRPSRDASDWRTDLWQRGSQWNLVNDGAPQWLGHASNEHYLYASGDATRAYNSTSENSADILHASRAIVWLKPDTVVVFDRAQSQTDNRFKRSWLQLATPASVNGHRASATTSGGQQLQITSLLPENASFLAVNSNEAHIDQTAARHEPMQVRLRLDAPGNPANVRFLQVLQAADRGASLPGVALVRSSNADYSGAVIGSTAVMFANNTGSAPASLSYTTATAVSTHIITGLTPGGSYTVSLSGNSLHLQAGGSLQADSAGVLRHVAGSTPGVFGGNRANYTLSRSGNSVSVTDNVNGGTVDVSSLSRLQFADSSLALDIQGTPGQVFRLYQAAFDRAPDLGGMGFHLYTMEGAGLSLYQVAQNFFNSAEFAAKYANTSHSQFITLLYANVLHRAPDAGGLAYWIDILERGLSDRITVLTNFSESQENRDGTQAVTQNGIAYIPYRP